jgi:signal transduction histidine kinase
LFSLIVGWVMSGRVLRPVGEITSVAREIQASDLSRRIGLEGPDDELKRLADTFDGMLERLDRAFTSQRQFLADTSHDLRTPLAVIRSNVELVTDDPSTSTEDWQRAGGIIRRNAEKMSVMIDDLLAAARLQAGKAQAVVIDLAHLVEHKAEEFSPLAGEQTVVLETRVVTALVQGVESSLDRALSNLMDNAVKAAPADSTIILGCGTEAGWAWMAVSDQGPGLPPEPADRVGLGLSIVSQIAESHGGSLATHVGPGGSGTVMVIWLPVGESTGRPPEHSPLS